MAQIRPPKAMVLRLSDVETRFGEDVRSFRAGLAAVTCVGRWWSRQGCEARAFPISRYLRREPFCLSVRESRAQVRVTPYPPLSFCRKTSSNPTGTSNSHLRAISARIE